MKSTSQAMSDLAPPARSRLVIMGHHDFTSVLLRLIGMELYKIWRRAMSKVLIILCILGMVLVFLPILLFALIVGNNPPLPPTCSQAPNVQGCVDQEPSPSQLASLRQKTIEVLSEPLRLPLSLGMSVEVMSRLGAVLIIILAGTIVGGEYGVGTIRLLFTRGPTRTEFFLSKIGTLMLCTALGLLATVLLGLILGLLLNFFTGVSLSFTFLSGAWFGHALLYVLSTVLGLVIYAIMALSFSVLGRATPAGIAAGLIWWGVEPILSSILSLAGNFTRGPTGSFLAAIPDYFIGTNISALAENQRQYLFGGQGSSLSDLHALLVLAVYLALFIGLAAWVNVRRDVTN